MKNFFRFSTCIFFLLFTLQAMGQSPVNETDTVFVPDEVARIEIQVHPDSLDAILDPENAENDHEYPATFTFANSLTTKTIANVGFRLRGNTSRFSAKKSFKISFNTFESNNFYGLEKINLNGEHNDPSIMRSRLSWDLFRHINLPASRSAYVELFINGEYKGLYINVEHVDEEFADSRFGNKSGNLYKCLWPADLVYLGSDPDLYKEPMNGDRRAYDLKTNEEIDDYADLAEFINVLNNTPDHNFRAEIEKVLNVNSVIKYLVIEILTGHWDAYSVNKNNFYLYHNLENSKFEFIPYDLDNTFGIDWFDIDWGNRNIYNWSGDWEPRPLYQRIMDNQVYRNQFSFYMNKILTEIYNEEQLFPYIETLKTMIDPFVEEDVYRTYDYGWNFDDYESSFTTALGDHVSYGLKPFITERNTTALIQLENINSHPAFCNTWYDRNDEMGTIDFFARIDDESSLNTTAFIRFNGGEVNQYAMNLYPNSDGNLYYTQIDIPIDSGEVNYYFEAEDQSGLVSRKPLVDNYNIYIKQPSVKLVVNEFMASNRVSIADNFGGFGDWLEIYNAGENEAFLGDKYLTDDLARPDKWQMPPITLQPGEFTLFWADENTDQGYHHTNFKLNRSGEEIGIFEKSGSVITPVYTINYGDQLTDVSSGSMEDGNVHITFLPAITPNYSNTDQTQATVTINAIMSYQAILGNFNPVDDFVDLAGTFNGWNGSGIILDPNEDEIYAHTIFNVPVNELIEYKFRINADWSTSEFPDHGPNRQYEVPEGLSILTHWYDDLVDPDYEQESTVIEEDIRAWPNPFAEDLNVRFKNDYQELSIVDFTGKVVFSSNKTEAKQIVLPLSHLQPGIYLLTLYSKNSMHHSVRILKR